MNKNYIIETVKKLNDNYIAVIEAAKDFQKNRPFDNEDDNISAVDMTYNNAVNLATTIIQLCEVAGIKYHQESIAGGYTFTFDE